MGPDSLESGPPDGLHQGIDGDRQGFRLPPFAMQLVAAVVLLDHEPLGQAIFGWIVGLIFGVLLLSAIGEPQCFDTDSSEFDTTMH